MNEDRTCTVEINKDNTKVLNDPNQDFCRKEYTYPLEEFKIDWDAVPHEHAQRHAETINGQTCIEYKAKRPLTAIYIKNDNTLSEADLNTKSITVCRMVFIGGRNITFRSFNSLDTGFYKDYKKNTTDLCTIKAAEPNVNADAEMIIGITDKTVLKTFFEKISQYNKLKVFKSLKLRWYSATGSSSMNVEKGSNGEFTLDSIKLMQQIIIKSTKVDNLIDIALTDFDNLKKSTNFKRGVIMVFTDKALGKDRDAAREFDHRNGYYTENGVEFFNPKNSVNVTVFMNILNYKEDETFSAKALTHVSLGAHYFESFDANGFIQNVVSMINVIEANLTERCDTETCNGFCDGKNRCTCPMCCENDCYYTYCDTTSGTCTPWPKAKPKMKIICEDVDKCKNTYHCVDGYGCVIKEYAKGCEPASKCNVTKCDSTTGKCKYVDTCTRDTVPYNGKCYTYKCQNGECVRDQVYATCPNNDDLCKELTCTDNACVLSEKKCVKTAPYMIWIVMLQNVKTVNVRIN
jgi:galactose-inhibitable lectin heavy subunit